MKTYRGGGASARPRDWLVSWAVYLAGVKESKKRDGRDGSTKPHPIHEADKWIDGPVLAPVNSCCDSHILLSNPRKRCVPLVRERVMDDTGWNAGARRGNPGTDVVVRVTRL